MRIYNLYILSVSTALLLSTVVMTALRVNTLATYYTVYVAAALVITELFIHLDSRAKRSLTVISIVLFVGFLFALALQIIRILV